MQCSSFCRKSPSHHRFLISDNDFLSSVRSTCEACEGIHAISGTHRRSKCSNQVILKAIKCPQNCEIALPDGNISIVRDMCSIVHWSNVMPKWPPEWRVAHPYKCSRLLTVSKTPGLHYLQSLNSRSINKSPFMRPKARWN